MSEFTDKLKRFFHIAVPAVIDEDAKVISVPAFEIPLAEDMPLHPAEPIQGAIEVAREGDKAIVRVKLKKKAVKKPVQAATKKRAKKRA